MTLAALKPVLVSAVNPTLELRQWLTEKVFTVDREDEAVSVLKARKSPSDYSAETRSVWFNAGVDMLEKKKSLLAESLLVRALLSDPANGQPIPLLAEALSKNGHPGEAKLAIRRQICETLLQRHFECTQTNAGNSDNHLFEYDLRRDNHQKGVLIHPAYPEVNTTIEAPTHLHDWKMKRFSATEVDGAEAKCIEIDNGYIWFDGFNIVVSNANRKIIEPLSLGHLALIDHCQNVEVPVQMHGTVCVLGNRSSSNYYHWMNDVLPRLEVLRASGIDLDSIDVFICEAPTHSFQHQTLAALGIDENRLHDPRSGRFIRAGKLLLPVYGSNSFSMRHAPWLPQFLRNSFLPGNMANGSPKRRLYISRGTKGARGVANERELIETLDKFGFEKVKAEGLSVSEQARLFSTAEVVFGPHGAGFTNTVFCDAGTHVIEAFADFITECFWVQSRLLNFKHSVVKANTPDDVAETKEPVSMSERRKSNRLAPIIIDCEVVEGLFKKLGIEAI